MKTRLTDTFLHFCLNRSAVRHGPRLHRPATSQAPKRPLAGQHGVGAIEFLAVVFPLLLATMAAFEVSRWHMTRETINLALLQAARAGSVSHAHPQDIEDAFLIALSPLYAPAGRHASPYERMIYELNQFEHDSGQRNWDIAILHPDVAEFADFMQQDLPIARQTGNPAINNNYQYEQHQQRSKGVVSGSTIFDANTLQLQARYLYAPVTPGMRRLLRMVFATIGQPGSPLATHGVLPIIAGVTIEMQSHPVFWQSAQTRHVYYARQAGFPSSRKRTRVMASTEHNASKASVGTLDNAPPRSQGRSVALPEAHANIAVDIGAAFQSVRLRDMASPAAADATEQASAIPVAAPDPAQPGIALQPENALLSEPACLP